MENFAFVSVYRDSPLTTDTGGSVYRRVEEEEKERSSPGTDEWDRRLLAQVSPSVDGPRTVRRVTTSEHELLEEKELSPKVHENMRRNQLKKQLQ